MSAAGWLDEHVAELVDAHRTTWATAGARALMDAGTSLAVLAAVSLVLVVVVVVRGAYRPAIAAALAVVISTIAAEALKELFDRARPPAELALVHLGGASMPSTDAARTAAGAVAVLVTLAGTTQRERWRWGVVLGAGVGVVGAAMVYLGGHWLTDVLAGWLLGAVLGAAAGLACRPRPEPRG